MYVGQHLVLIAPFIKQIQRPFPAQIRSPRERGLTSFQSSVGLNWKKLFGSGLLNRGKAHAS